MPDQHPGPTEWGESRVGVGPWEVEHPGQPLPTDPRFDAALLAEGDRRNVVDAYRYWTRDAIVADIDTRRHDLHVAIENFEHDANIGTVVRTANAFAVNTVHIVGRRRWNRRGAMVTDRYQHLLHHPDVDTLLQWAKEQGRSGALMTCSIAQFGSTRSINAGVAAGIAMHAWIRQHADISQAW